MRGGVGRRPFANEAEAAADLDAGFVAERRNRQIDRRQRAVFARFGLAVFHRPARVAVLLRELFRLVRPALPDF